MQRQPTYWRTRFGSFVAFYGPAETTALIRRVLRGERPDQSAA